MTFEEAMAEVAKALKAAATANGDDIEIKMRLANMWLAYAQVQLARDKEDVYISSLRRATNREKAS